MGIWSWALTGLGLLCVYLSGYSRRLGWCCGLINQCVWLAYGLVSGQDGFTVSAFAFGALYVHNLVKYCRASRVRGLAEAAALAGTPA